MDLFTEWLLRSVRRDGFGDSPVAVIQKLGSLPQPLGDADKDILVGAVLTMSSSLHLALGMLQGVLLQEKSQDRLGEVLCPTLGHLLGSVRTTLVAFQSTSPHQSPGAAFRNTALRSLEAAHPVLRRDGWQAFARPASSPATTSHARRPRVGSWTKAERFPPVEESGAAPRRLPVEVDMQGRPEAQLAKALQAELRVQAAIHVAIESLEFAEGQLKVVKEVNQLHGGGKYLIPRASPVQGWRRARWKKGSPHTNRCTDFEPIQRHFYQGYNRLLFRALELQRRELGLHPSVNNSTAVLPVPEHPYPQPNGHKIAQQPGLRKQPSVTFQTLSPVQSPATTPRSGNTMQIASPERRPLGRRNTIQGIDQEGT